MSSPANTAQRGDTKSHRTRTCRLVNTTKSPRPSGRYVLATRHARRHRRKYTASSPPITFVAVPSPTSSISLQVRETDSANKYAVSNWGQLHITVLLFELEAGPPVVTVKTNEETWKKEEPFEMVEAWVPEEDSGSFIDLSNNWKGKQQDMGLDDNRDSVTVIKYLIPTCGMLGMRSEISMAIVASVFDLYREKISGDILSRDKGSLLSFKDNVVTSFGCSGAQDRGELFVKSDINMYKKMIPVVPARRQCPPGALGATCPATTLHLSLYPVFLVPIGAAWQLQ